MGRAGLRADGAGIFQAGGSGGGAAAQGDQGNQGTGAVAQGARLPTYRRPYLPTYPEKEKGAGFNPTPLREAARRLSGSAET